MSEEWFNTDGVSVTVVRDPDVEVSDKELREAFRNHPELSAIGNWVQSFAALDSTNFNRAKRSNSIFERDRYVNPLGVFDQFRVARDAAHHDDIVSGLIEATEALAFNKVRVECGDEDEENVWDQILYDIKLDVRLREIWRDLFIYSQSYVASFWTNKTYRVEGFGEQRRRRRQMNLTVPTDLTLLDPLKVLPVGDFVFDREQLAYVANRVEGVAIDEVVAGKNTTDQVITSLITGRYTPSTHEMGLLQDVTGSDRSGLDNLFLLNPQLVWRHTATKAAYERFAPVRMSSIFELLDMKHQLRQNDRSHLLGATNFIVLVKKGSDAHPATSGEMENLQANVRMVARTPVIVGDHRLDIEIITPNLDTTLDPKRYNNIDSRITSRLAQILHVGGFCLTPDVEIMTNRGWLHYDELQVGDRAWSIDPETLTGVWSDVEAVNVFDHDGPMHSIKTRRLDVLSTPNHRWFTQYDPKHGMHSTRHRFVTSENLGLTDRIPLVAEPGDLPVGPTYKDEIVRLVAWYMTEGCRRYEYENGKRCFIAQSESANPDHVESIARDLRGLYGEPAKIADGGLWWYDGSSFNISAEVGGDIVNICPGRVKAPSYDFLNSLTYDQLVDFVKVCIDGDGWRESNGRQSFMSKDPEIIDVFEYCCVLLGLSVTHRDAKSYTTSDGRSENTYRVTVGSVTHACPARAVNETQRNGASSDMTSVYYRGVVWCPTTSTGTWLARRNGNVFYTGNSAGVSGDDSLKLTRVIARGIESRRQMIKQQIERRVLRPIFELNDELKCRPKLEFTPRNVALDFDPNFLQTIRELYQSGDLSRETMLGVVDHEQEEEAHRRQLEADKYDDVFEPRQQTPGQMGSRFGGNRRGGGDNPDSRVANPIPRRNENDVPEDERRNDE